MHGAWHKDGHFSIFFAHKSPSAHYPDIGPLAVSVKGVLEGITFILDPLTVSVEARPGQHGQGDMADRPVMRAPVYGLPQNFARYPELDVLANNQLVTNYLHGRHLDTTPGHYTATAHPVHQTHMRGIASL
jgi:hypothetical protein